MCITGFPYTRTRIAWFKIKFFLLPRPIRYVRFAVYAQHGTISIDDGNHSVICLVLFFKKTELIYRFKSAIALLILSI